MITPHKGGRTEFVSGFRFTPAEKADLKKVLATREMSLADWVSEKVIRENDMNKAKLIKLVEKLVKTNPYPHNETGLDDWITEGDTGDMTPQEIAQEWDEVNSQ